MRLLDDKKDWFLFWIALAMFVLNLIGFILSANAHNAYNKMQYDTTQVKQEYQQYSGIITCQEKDIDEKLQNLLDTLNNGIDRLKEAMWVFVYRFMCGIMLAPIMMIVGKIYDFAKDEFVASFWPDNWVNLCCEILIAVLFVYDILSPFSEVGDYIELLNEMRDVMTDISFKMMQIIQ